MCLSIFQHSSKQTTRHTSRSPIEPWNEKHSTSFASPTRNSKMFNRKSRATSNSDNFASYEAIKEPPNYQNHNGAQNNNNNNNNSSSNGNNQHNGTATGAAAHAQQSQSKYRGNKAQDQEVKDVIDDYFDNPTAFFKNATELLNSPSLSPVHFGTLNIWLGYHNNKQSFFRFRQALESCNTEIRMALEHHAEIAPDVMRVREQAIEALKPEKAFMERQQQLCEDNWTSRGKGGGSRRGSKSTDGR